MQAPWKNWVPAQYGIHFKAATKTSSRQYWDRISSRRTLILLLQKYPPEEAGFFIFYFDSLVFFIESIRSLLPGGAGSIYSFIFFLYEKSLFRTSILEASVYQDPIPEKSSREATALDRQRKIPTCNGDFSKEYLLYLFRRQKEYIIFSRKSNFSIRIAFLRTPSHSFMLASTSSEWMMMPWILVSYSLRGSTCASHHTSSRYVPLISYRESSLSWSTETRGLSALSEWGLRRSRWIRRFRISHYSRIASLQSRSPW